MIFLELFQVGHGEESTQVSPGRAARGGGTFLLRSVNICHKLKSSVKIH